MKGKKYIKLKIFCCLITVQVLYGQGLLAAKPGASRWGYRDFCSSGNNETRSHYITSCGLTPSSLKDDDGTSGVLSNISADSLELYKGMMVDSVVIRGNRKTKSVAITREMATKEGEPLDSEKMARDINYIRGMGYFSHVYASIEKSSRRRCKVVVTVSERPDLFMKYPYPVLNYHIERGISYGIRWRVKNFRGLSERISVYAVKRRDKEHGGHIAWNAPWMLGHRIRFGLRFYNYRRLEEPVDEDFIKGQNGGSFSLGIPLSQNLIRQVWLGTSFMFEARHSALSTTEAEKGTTRDYYHQKFISLGFSINYDSRDNKLTPSRGIWSGFSINRERAISGMDQRYSFFSFFSNGYFSLPNVGTFILALSTRVRDGDVPYFFKMELGGGDDLRGYESDGRRGRAKILNTVQWRRRLFGPNVFSIPHIGEFDITVNTVVFYDTGTLMDSFEDIRNITLLNSGGLGFEIMSPFQDLVRAEIAINEKGGVQYYWTSGMRF